MTDPKARYLAYLACLNARRWEELDAFVADEVTHNGRAMTRAGYAAMIAENVAAIPDLRFEPELILADADTIAARLVFHCTPQREFLGLAPTGRCVTFHENVFTALSGGRIRAVFSLLDREAPARQLAGCPALPLLPQSGRRWPRVSEVG